MAVLATLLAEPPSLSPAENAFSAGESEGGSTSRVRSGQIPGQTDSQARSKTTWVFNLRFIWTSTCIDLCWLARKPFFPAVHQATPQGPSTFPHTAGVLADLVPRTKSASRSDGPPGPEPERFRLCPQISAVSRSRCILCNSQLTIRRKIIRQDKDNELSFSVEK